MFEKFKEAYCFVIVFVLVCVLITVNLKFLNDEC